MVRLLDVVIIQDANTQEKNCKDSSLTPSPETYPQPTNQSK